MPLVKLEISSLLSQAGTAHSIYEQAALQGERDQDWPGWYAAYLLKHGLADLISNAATAEQLRRLLAECDLEYKQINPGQDWPDYYAQRIEATFGRASGA